MSAVHAAGLRVLAERPNVALVFGDARLDNAADLRRELREPEAGAGELIASAYETWGDGFAARLLGDFAIVIQDLRHRSRLVAARDALGVRSLYYRRVQGTVRFARDLRALAEAGDAADDGFLAEVLAGDIVSVADTPFAAIKRVPAGHVLVADDAGVRLRRYWEPPRAILRGSVDDFARMFRATFDEAVRSRAQGERTVAVHLSGGLDSTSVFGTLARSHDGVVVPVSNVLPWPEADERRWIAIAAAYSNLQPLIVEPPVDPAPHALDEVERSLDVPDVPAGAPLLAPLQNAAHARGARVVMTGFGGDQWWAGEAVFAADLLRQGRFQALRRWRAGGGRMGQLAWHPGAFMQHAVRPLVPATLRDLTRAIRPAKPPSWIDPAFAAKVHLMDRLRQRPPAIGAPSESWRRMRWRIESGEEAIALGHLDRLGSATGVELRHPFYDRRLVELSFMIPPGAHLADRSDRSVMRRAMRDRLPAEIAARTSKADLTRLLVHAARHPGVARHRGLASLAEAGWIRPDAAAAIVSRTIDAGDVDAAPLFWRLIGVEAWLNRAFQAR